MHDLKHKTFINWHKNIFYFKCISIKEYNITQSSSTFRPIFHLWHFNALCLNALCLNVLYLKIAPLFQVSLVSIGTHIQTTLTAVLKYISCAIWKNTGEIYPIRPSHGPPFAGRASFASRKASNWRPNMLQCYIECIHHKEYSGCTIGKVTGFEKKG